MSGLDTENVNTRRCFSLAEMLSATSNFDDSLVIGRGGFGRIYKGSIDNGTTIVAIKRLDAESEQGKEEFWNEVETLSKLQHTHIVTLIGHCNECLEMIIVYEYVARGSLADHIFETSRKESGTNTSHLTWEQRLSICIGVARGLYYLHTRTNESVIYGDVKASNILLDEEWVPKISDFGLSKCVTSNLTPHVTTNIIKGTFGYLDPDYYSTHRLTKKSDVYAFGIVLFEVLCGRRAVDVNLEEEQISLILWAENCDSEGNVDKIIDLSLRGQISECSLKYFVKIANECVQIDSTKRPSMAIVVERLELALASTPEVRLEGIIKDRLARKQEESLNKPLVDEKLELALASTPEVRLEGIIKDRLARKQEESLNKPLVDEKLELASTSKPKRRFEVIITKMFRMDRWWDRKNNGYQSELEKELRSKINLDNETPLYRQFSLSEIRGATDDFNVGLLVGHGCSGMVYKGFLDAGTLLVAIKRLKEETSRKWGKVMAETQVQSLVCDLNIVRLIGFCNEEHELILVYEYMANGSLRNHLYGAGNIVPLGWKKRLEVCIDAARVLQHLHAGAESRIVHGNITSSKLLLDENWVAKLADFTWSKSTPTSMSSDDFTAVFRGTWGYLDPDYLLHGKLTQKYDVYSFGVVLLEILCGKKPSNKENALLVVWFKCGIQRVSIYQLIDPYLIEKIAPLCLREFVKITLSCLLIQGIRRPSMEDVVESLQSALDLQEAWQNQYEFGSHLSETNPSSFDNISSNDGEFPFTETDAATSVSRLDFDITWDDLMRFSSPIIHV